jgi:hypothetical protein
MQGSRHFGPVRRRRGAGPVCIEANVRSAKTSKNISPIPARTDLICSPVVVPKISDQLRPGDESGAVPGAAGEESTMAGAVAAGGGRADTRCGAAATVGIGSVVTALSVAPGAGGGADGAGSLAAPPIDVSTGGGGRDGRIAATIAGDVETWCEPRCGTGCSAIIAGRGSIRSTSLTTVLRNARTRPP